MRSWVLYCRKRKTERRSEFLVNRDSEGYESTISCKDFWKMLSGQSNPALLLCVIFSFVLLFNII